MHTCHFMSFCFQYHSLHFCFLSRRLDIAHTWILFLRARSIILDLKLLYVLANFINHLIATLVAYKMLMQIFIGVYSILFALMAFSLFVFFCSDFSSSKDDNFESMLFWYFCFQFVVSKVVQLSIFSAISSEVLAVIPGHCEHPLRFCKKVIVVLRTWVHHRIVARQYRTMCSREGGTHNVWCASSICMWCWICITSTLAIGTA